MTTRIKIINDQAEGRDVKVDVFDVALNEKDKDLLRETYIIGPMAEVSIYLHSGNRVIIDEMLKQ